MTRLFSTLFGRLALAIFVVLLISHATLWLTFRARHEVNRIDPVGSALVTELAILEQSIPLLLPAGQSEPRSYQVPGGTGIVVYRASRVSPPAGFHRLPPPLQRIEDDLRERGGADLAIRWSDQGPPVLWIGFGGAGERYWMVAPVPGGREGRGHDPFVYGLVIMFFLALAAALLLLWQINRPLRDLGRALMALGRGEKVAPLPPAGPAELRELARNFNQMMTDLDRYERERQTLLAGVSHDLRAPITRLRLRAEMMQSEDQPGVSHDIDDIERITEQFLDYAKGASAIIPDTRHDVGALVDSVAQGYRLRGIDIRVHRVSVPMVRLDPEPLKRALANIIDNSLAYAKPPVELFVLEEGNKVLVRVRDAGAGIPDDQHEQALRPFVRLDPSRGGQGHCGLGLAIVEQVVRQHGGTVELHNAPTGGLDVDIRLPR